MLVSSSVKVSSFLSAAMSSIAYLVQGYGNRYNIIDRPFGSEMNKVVSDRTFGTAELLLFGSAQMTEPFSAEHRTFFFTIYCIFQNGYLRYFKLDRKMKLFCGDNFTQKYSTTFKIVSLVRSGVKETVCFVLLEKQM